MELKWSFSGFDKTTYNFSIYFLKNDNNITAIHSVIKISLEVKVRYFLGVLKHLKLITFTKIFIGTQYYITIIMQNTLFYTILLLLLYIEKKKTTREIDGKTLCVCVSMCACECVCV